VVNPFTTLRIKLNSFVNLMTGLNTWKDRSLGYEFSEKPRLSSATLRGMYKDSPVTRTVVNSVVDDSFRKGIDIDSENSDDLLKAFTDLKIFEFSKRASKSARQHGGACAFYFINDGNFSQLPVNLKRIRDIKPAFILSKNNLQLMTADIKGNPIDWFEGSEVEFYKIVSGKEYQIWHKSRVLEFNGAYAGEDCLATNSGWYESVIDMNRKSILLYEVFGDSITSLTDNVIQEVLRVEGLEKMLRTPSGKSQAFNMFQAIMMGKSVVNKMIIDKKDEFQYHSANLSGYEKIATIVKENLAMSSRIPVTKLFGTSPSASIGSQSGSYEEKLWINEVESFQKDELRPNFDKAWQWVKALNKIPESEVIVYSFPSLYPIDPKTDAEIKEIQSKTDKNYIEAQVVKKEEIALSRFSGKWNTNTQIDIQERESLLINPSKEIEIEEPEDEV
jgi:phage-related protein (TIGR01555 family)